MPEFTLDNSFHYGCQKQTTSAIHTETIEKLLKKITSDRLRQFAHKEQIQDNLIWWKKKLVKINEVLDYAVGKQWACDVDFLLDEFQTEVFQRMLLQDGVDDALDKSDDPTAMSKVQEVNARLQDTALQVDLLGLKESSEVVSAR